MFNRKLLVVIFIGLILAAVGLKVFNEQKKPDEGEIVVRFIDMLGSKADGQAHLNPILQDPELGNKFTYVYIQQDSPQFQSHVSTYKVDLNNATVFTDKEGTKVYGIYTKILSKEEIAEIAKKLY